MPAVSDSPEVVAYTAQDFQEEPPPIHATPPGFWQTVTQYVQRPSIPPSTGTLSSSPRTRHPIETPAELLARAYPTLFIRAFGGV
jgi:hypothetical protein